MLRSIVVALAFSSLSLAGCGQLANSDAKAMLAESNDFYIIIGQNTVFKKTKDDSSLLQDKSEKCDLPVGTKVSLTEQPKYDANHYYVSLVGALPECDFTKGFVFSKHISKTSIRSDFNGPVRAFLDTIGYAEGTNDRYDIEFTFVRFYSYVDHPRELRCSGRLCSDAAGRYQFLSTTWDNLARRLGLSDFSPENQDRAAVQLIKDAGVYSSVVNAESYDDFARAAYGISTTWASFPGSPYGQPVYSTSHLYSKYKDFLNRY